MGKHLAGLLAKIFNFTAKFGRGIGELSFQKPARLYVEQVGGNR
jgi:hypothetical protein